MSLKDLNPRDDKVLVFIPGFMPSEEDRALASEHGTKAFRHLTTPDDAYPIEGHRYCVSVDPALIPEGYNHYSPQEATPITPVANPTQPPRKKSAPKTAPFISEGDI